MSWRGSCLTRGVTRLRMLLPCAAAIISAGCGGGSPLQKLTAQHGGKLYAVSTEAAAFYRYGPQQGNGPDRTLPRDTLVKLIRPSFGYAKVQVLEDKQQGYVAAEDLRLAPPSLIASASATPPPMQTASNPTAENFELNDPALKSSQEQLPPPDLPPPNEAAAPAPSPSP